jgi:branched-chain amino acid transport system ATP-binding protein
VSSLSISNVVAGYGAVNVLHGVSLEAPSGATVALLGPNGNGKSTLIKAILGLVRVRAGTIVFEADGRRHELHKMETEKIVALGIGVVPEGRRLFANLTVRENLLLGAYRGRARQRIKQNLDYVHAAFPILVERERQYVGTMSGGQQQMVAIARALMSEPTLLLIDEPSVGLAPLIVKQTIQKIRDLKEERGLTVLMAEQSFHQATEIADHAYIIAHGEIVLSGEDMAAMGGDNAVRAAYLGG